MLCWGFQNKFLSGQFLKASLRRFLNFAESTKSKRNQFLLKTHVTSYSSWLQNENKRILVSTQKKKTYKMKVTFCWQVLIFVQPWTHKTNLLYGKHFSLFTFFCVCCVFFIWILCIWGITYLTVEQTNEMTFKNSTETTRYTRYLRYSYSWRRF